MIFTSTTGYDSAILSDLALEHGVEHERCHTQVHSLVPLPAWPEPELAGMSEQSSKIQVRTGFAWMDGW